MDKHYYEKVFSTQRMQKYFNRYPDNEGAAIKHYHNNIELSEGFYSCLSMFEVALRNSLNRELTEQFGEEWYLRFETIPGLRNLKSQINTAKKHIANRDETITPNKVVAELTLGFWVRLLNAEYELVLWKPLRKAFPYLEKAKRQRHKVSAPVNKIRNFRNRVFHHEPISWNLDNLMEIHEMIFEVMSWINQYLPEIAKNHDRIPQIMEKVKTKIIIAEN